MSRKNDGQWFRFYERTLENPKAQRLGGETFKAWVNLLCLAKRHGGQLPPLPDIAFALRADETVIEALLLTLVNANLFDLKRGTYVPHDWNEHQYISDTSTNRVNKHRKSKLKKNETLHETVDETFHPVTETPPETEADTDTDSEAETDAESSSLRSHVAGEPDVSAVPKPEFALEPEMPDFLKRPPTPLPESERASINDLPEADRARLAYAKIAERVGWPDCRDFSAARKVAIVKRIDQCGGFKGWCEMLAKAANSDFLTGKTDRPFRPTGIDWFLKPANITKILEGAYDNRANASAKRGIDAFDEGARLAAAYD